MPNIAKALNVNGNPKARILIRGRKLQHFTIRLIALKNKAATVL
jgi:hypothetical protein